MIVVADTSPINYLILIDAISVLPDLYETIVVPNAVFEELLDTETPEKVRDWIENLPNWFLVKKAAELHEADLSKLDAGEKEAIFLVEELNADALMIDDRAGREEAVKRGIFIIGTLGVLNSAAQKKLLDLPITLEKLRQTNFRVSEKLILDLLQLDNDRMRRT
ncbi:MAG: DUF3368 domain-containing protein [Pyrinomonadaceae bacterium]